MNFEYLWPFAASTYDTPRGKVQCFHMGASDRIDAVRRMTDRRQLDAALNIPDLQKSVSAAIKRRIKQLDGK